MTTRLSRLIQLNAKADSLIQLGRYDYEDGDGRMLKDAAIGVGTLGAVGGGGLLLRNRGDKVNEARWNILNANRAAASKGPEIPHLAPAASGVENASSIATKEAYRGTNWRATKTGLKDLLASIKGRLGGLGRATIKASARIERLVELNKKADNLINLDIEDGVIGAGLVGGTGLGLYGLHQRGAKTALNAREKKLYGKLGQRVAGANIRVGAGQLLGDLAKKLR